jgi:hypothetical protein
MPILKQTLNRQWTLPDDRRPADLPIETPWGWLIDRIASQYPELEFEM